MKIDIFLNDYYELLKLMYNNEVVILDERIIPLTQIQIANSLRYSKMKVNAMFSVLQKEGYVAQKGRGKYIITEDARILVEKLQAAETWEG